MDQRRTVRSSNEDILRAGQLLLDRLREWQEEVRRRLEASHSALESSFDVLHSGRATESERVFESWQGRAVRLAAPLTRPKTPIRH